MWPFNSLFNSQTSESHPRAPSIVCVSCILKTIIITNAKKEFWNPWTVGHLSPPTSISSCGRQAAGVGHARLGSTLHGPTYYGLYDSEDQFISLRLSFSFYKMGMTVVALLLGSM